MADEPSTDRDPNGMERHELVEEVLRVRRELDTMREVAQGNKRHVKYLTEENEALRAELARVRTQVAEDIAEELTEWATRQRAQAAVAWNPQTKRDLLAYARAYENAAAIVRERAGKGFPSAPAALQDRVWWLHRCDPSDPKRAWLSGAPGVPRPVACPGCGGSGWGWFEARPVVGSTERDDRAGANVDESLLPASTGGPDPRPETQDR